jgi:hypothetical protein
MTWALWLFSKDVHWKVMLALAGMLPKMGGWAERTPPAVLPLHCRSRRVRFWTGPGAVQKGCRWKSDQRETGMPNVPRNPTDDTLRRRRHVPIHVGES